MSLLEGEVPFSIIDNVFTVKFDGIKLQYDVVLKHIDIPKSASFIINRKLYTVIIGSSYINKNTNLIIYKNGQIVHINDKKEIIHYNIIKDFDYTLENRTYNGCKLTTETIKVGLALIYGRIGIVYWNKSTGIFRVSQNNVSESFFAFKYSEFKGRSFDLSIDTIDNIEFTKNGQAVLYDSNGKCYMLDLGSDENKVYKPINRDN